MKANGSICAQELSGNSARIDIVPWGQNGRSVASGAGRQCTARQGPASPVFGKRNFAFVLGTGYRLACGRAGARAEPVRHRVDYTFTRAGWNCLVVDKISTVPRGYFRNRFARPNSQACTRIAGQPEVSVLVPLRAHLERCLKTLV